MLKFLLGIASVASTVNSLSQVNVDQLIDNVATMADIASDIGATVMEAGTRFICDLQSGQSVNTAISNIFDDCSSLSPDAVQSIEDILGPAPEISVEEMEHFGEEDEPEQPEEAEQP